MHSGVPSNRNRQQLARSSYGWVFNATSEIFCSRCLRWDGRCVMRKQQRVISFSTVAAVDCINSAFEQAHLDLVGLKRQANWQM